MREDTYRVGARIDRLMIIDDIQTVAIKVGWNMFEAI